VWVQVKTSLFFKMTF